jgi:hypothetical protein
MRMGCGARNERTWRWRMHNRGGGRGGYHLDDIGDGDGEGGGGVASGAAVVRTEGGGDPNDMTCDKPRTKRRE